MATIDLVSCQKNALLFTGSLPQTIEVGNIWRLSYLGQAPWLHKNALLHGITRSKT